MSKPIAANAPPSETSRADSLSLVAGALALDFANTASGRGGERHLDHLRSSADVVAWALHAGIIGDALASDMRDRIARSEKAFARLLPEALALREAVHGIISAIARKAAPEKSDLALLSAHCASALAKATIDIAAEGARWRWPIAEPLPETILGPIALAAVGLLREGDPARLKQCPGEHCGWVFFDMTKNRSRRWCDMSVCGNRAKAKAHYRRSKLRAKPAAGMAEQECGKNP